MTMSESIRYSRDHLWVIAGADSMRVGVSDFLQETLGEVVFVRLPTLGTHITQGEAFCFVESAKAVSELYAPVSGSVCTTNSNLDKNPRLLNTAPLGEGWLCDVTPDPDTTSLDELLSAEDYRAFILREL